MTLYDNILLALGAIRQNLLRTVLTFSIIAFGIMALVGILTAIDSLKASLANQFATIGANTFNIVPKGTGIQAGGPRRRRSAGPDITYQEALEFKQRYPFPAAVSVSLLSSTDAQIKYGTEETNPNVVIYGADENYLTTGGFEIDHGRYFTGSESSNGRLICILGRDVAEKLFGNPERALGKTVSVQNLPMQVIAVLKSKGSSFSFAGDRLVIVPMMTAKMHFGNQTGNYNLSVAVRQSADLDFAISEAMGLFRNVRKLELSEEENFEIQKSDSLVGILIENTATIRFAAIFIGLITLLGAAIGLMNIMLVSVTERTREIGICKSIGATSSGILIQFLTEAVVICQIGGLLGIVLGIFVGNLVSLLLGSAFVVPWAWIAMGLALCFVTGLVSGIYPAAKAAQLDPIESLRHE
jgi:putative ABC transport system permease protein